MSDLWKKLMGMAAGLAVSAAMMAIQPVAVAEAKTGVEIRPGKDMIQKGKTTYFTLDLKKAARNNKCKWRINNTKIAKITKSHNVTKSIWNPVVEPSAYVKGLKLGKATLIVKLDGKTYKSKMTVVKQLPKISNGSLGMKVGGQKVLSVKNTENQVTWKVTDGAENITLEDQGGSVIVTGQKDGMARIKAKVKGYGHSLFCTVRVGDVQEIQVQGPAAPEQSATPIGSETMTAEPGISGKPAEHPDPSTGSAITTTGPAASGKPAERPDPSTGSAVTTIGPAASGKPADRPDPSTGPAVTTTGSVASGKPADRLDPSTGPAVTTTGPAASGKPADRPDPSTGPAVTTTGPVASGKPADRLDPSTGLTVTTAGPSIEEDMDAREK